MILMVHVLVRSKRTAKNLRDDASMFPHLDAILATLKITSGIDITTPSRPFVRVDVKRVTVSEPSSIMCSAESACDRLPFAALNSAVRWLSMVLQFGVSALAQAVVVNRAHSLTTRGAFTSINRANFTRGRRRASVGFSHGRNLSFLCVVRAGDSVSALPRLALHYST